MTFNRIRTKGVTSNVVSGLPCRPEPCVTLYLSICRGLTSKDVEPDVASVRECG